MIQSNSITLIRDVLRKSKRLGKLISSFVCAFRVRSGRTGGVSHRGGGSERHLHRAGESARGAARARGGVRRQRSSL